MGASFVFAFVFKILFTYFLERVREREGKRKTSMCDCFSHNSCWGPGHNLGMCPDWGLNQ